MNAPGTVPSLLASASLGDASRVALILNPLSFRAARGRLAHTARQLAARHGADCLEAREPAQFCAAVDDCLARGLRRLVILAGDGTVHAIADHLAHLPEHVAQPQLCVLGGGRTNLIAGDVGGRGGLVRKLDAALAGRGFDDPAREQRRHALLMEQASGPSRAGFFVAGAMIDDIIRLVHERRHGGTGWHRTGHAATPWSLLRMLLRALFLGERLLPPRPHLRLDAGALGRMDGLTRVLVASTLEHQQGLLDPYANRGEGPLRITAVSEATRGFWMRLPLILVGRFTSAMRLEHGYLSGRCAQLEVHGLRSYTLDGEKFDADPNQPLVIRAGRELRFMVPPR